MGMYDTAIVTCPKCGAEIEYQSKAGECSLLRYHVLKMPPRVAGDLDGEEQQCDECAAVIRLHTQYIIHCEIVE